MKIFSKLTAIVSTIAVVSSFVVMPMSASADTVVYSGDPTWTAVNGTAGTGTGYVNGDSTQVMDTTYFYQDGGGGSRGGYAYFVNGTAPADGNVYQLDWYMNLNAATSADSHVYLMGTNDTAAAEASSGAILDFYMTSWSGTLTVNGQSLLDDVTIGSTSYYSIVADQTRTSGTGLIKYSALIDFDAKQVTLTVNGTKATSTYTLDFVDDTVTSLYGFKAYCGRWYSGAATADVTLTEIESETSDTTAETLASIEFDSFPSGNTLVAGADENTAQSNPISVKLTGSEGSDLTANYDNYTVDYTLKGFRWIADKNEASTDAEGSNIYCDSYGELVVDETTHEADFKLKAHAFNYYGAVVATVTYGDTVLTVEEPLIYLGNTSNTDANTVLPKGGYVSDFSSYSDDMAGYVCTKNTYTGSDIILGGFNVAGSDGSAAATLTKDGSDKFIRMKKATASKSAMMANTFPATSGQLIFEQDVRFNSNGGRITLTQGYAFWSSSSSYAEALTLSYSDSAITLNGTTLTNGDSNASFATGTWYKVVFSIDKTTETAYAQVYNSTGTTLLGETSNVAWTSSCNPTFYAIGLGNSNTGTIDLGSYYVYNPAVDSSKFTLTAESETLSIPEAQSTTLTASALTADGYPVTGTAEWTITDDSMAEGVTITPDSTDSHKAVVAVSTSASAGTLPVQVTIGGYSKTIELTLTSSDDSVKFTKSETSVTIPLEADVTSTATFAAEVIDANANKLSDCTLAVYDKTNTTQLTTLPTGISFNNGVLSVASNAQPITLTIRATGTNSAGETLSKAVKVIVHGYLFDFGAGEEEDVTEGYTAVSPSTAYTEKLGYGIEGTATAAGTASTTDASTDYLTGTFTFKANVESNKIYTVNVYYSGSAASEYVNSDLSGVALTSDSLAVATYNVPVFDGVLDFAFTDSSVAYITIEKQADKTARTIPNVFSIGDSTAANNGSWAYVLNSTQSNYTNLTALVSFSNNGRGGRNLCTYYTQGLLRNVLNQIQPGDYVMIGDMGTNGMGSYFEEDFNYYIDCCKALGANVILNSYSPHGAVGNYTSGYDSDTQTFTSYRQDSYDNVVRAIYTERADELAGFVDIGKNADTSFNAYVDDYAANGYESRDAAAQAIIACFTDHNHYSGLASTLMIEGYNGTKGVVSELVRIIGENTVVPELAAITTEALTIENDSDSIPAKGWKAEFVQGDDNLQPSKLVWNITSTMGSTIANPEVEISTTISGGATVRYGLIITGTEEQLESLTVEAELE